MNKDENKLNYYTYKLNMITLNILAIILFIVVSSIVFCLEYKDNYIINYDIISLLILVFIWLIIHIVTTFQL